MSLASLNFVLTSDINDFQTKMRVAQKSFEQFAKKMEHVGKSMSTYLTLPIAAAAGASIKFASDFNESLNKVEVAFKDNSQSVKDWSKDSIQQFGMASGTALDMAALFGDMATGMGINSKQAADMSTKLVGLAGDMASFKNVSADVAATALKSIFTGETESLKNLGVVMTEANLKAFALTQGITKNYESFSEAEKVQLRYNFVLSKTVNSQGDFAKTSGGTANQMRIFQESMKNLSASFGQIILPAFTGLVKKLNEAVKWFGSLDESTKKTIVIVAGIAAAIGPLLMGLSMASKGIGMVISGFSTLVRIIPVITAFCVSNPFMLIVAGITAAVAGIVLLIKHFDSLAEKQKEFQKNNAEKKAQSEAVRKITNFKSYFAKQGMTDAESYVKARDLYLKQSLDKSAKLLIEIGNLQKEKFNAEMDGNAMLANGIAKNISLKQIEVEAIKKEIDAVKEDVKAKNDQTSATGANSGSVIKSTGYITKLTEEITKLQDKQKTAMDPAEVKQYEDRLEYLQKQIQAAKDFGMTLEQLGKTAITPLAKKTPTSVSNGKTEGRTQSPMGNWLPSEIEVAGRVSSTENMINGLVESVKTSALDVSGTIGDLINSSLTGFGEWLGGLFTGESSLTSFLNFILSSISDFAIEMGKQLIAVGIGVEAFKAALKSLNGIGAIVAGVALVALGSAFKALMANGPKMASGGIIPPGFNNDTYPAMLTSGEMVVPKPIALRSNMMGGMINSMQNIQLYSRITGNDIYMSNNRTVRQKGRTV